MRTGTLRVDRPTRLKIPRLAETAARDRTVLVNSRQVAHCVSTLVITKQDDFRNMTVG